MSINGYKEEQIEMAKQLQASFRPNSSATQSLAAYKRSPDGLVRPLYHQKYDGSSPDSSSYSSVKPKSYAGASPQPGKKSILQPHSKFQGVPKRAASASKPSVRSASAPYRQMTASMPISAPPNTPAKNAVPGGSAPKTPVYKNRLAAHTPVAPPHHVGETGVSEKKKRKTEKEVDNGGPAKSLKWKPIVSFYSEEEKPKVTQPQAEPKVSTVGTKTSMNENMPPGGKSTTGSRLFGDEEEVDQDDVMETDDLIDFDSSKLKKARCTAKKAETRSNLSSTDLLSSAFDDVSLSESNVKMMALTPDNGHKEANKKHVAVPVHAPKGVREALDLNRHGKPVTWVWSAESPRAREVSEEETTGVRPSPERDGDFACKWVRPSDGKKQPPHGFKDAMEIDRPAPPRNVGLKGSRHA